MLCTTAAAARLWSLFQREREILEGLSTSCAKRAESLSFLFHPTVLKGSREHVSVIVKDKETIFFHGLQSFLR